MEVLIVGCERSGTKMLSQKLGTELGVTFKLENKHTIASFKYQEELKRWELYKDDVAITNYTKQHEKHTLNCEINIQFLKWVKETWPDVKIYYIIRDGRNVVSSIIAKIWGHSQTADRYKIGFEEACIQWNTVVDTTWDWAQANCKIIKYEDLCDITSNPLTPDLYEMATKRLYDNLNKIGYKI
jgi:hypothetical protein